MLKRAPLGAALAAYLMISGCSSTSTNGGASAPSEPTAASVSSGATTPAGANAANSVRVIDPRRSVVRVVHDNPFFPPAWQVNQFLPLAASGFVVDSTGLVVTSAAITAGRDTVKVFIGEDTIAREARVVGRTVCDGLALLSLPTPNPSFLSVAASITAGPATAVGHSNSGAPVQVAGQLGGTPVAHANRTLSVKNAHSFDARLDSASIGAPVLDASGRVSGVVADSGFVLPASSVRNIVDSLGRGLGVEPGISVVRMDDVSDLQRGVFITSVDRGSDADAVTTVPGDVVRNVNGRDIESGATIAPFCDALALGSGQLRMSGFNRFNGQPFDRLVGNGNLLSAGRNATTIAPITGADLYTKFTEVSDSTKLLRVKVPQGWSTVDERPSPLGPAVTATTNLTGFGERWESPGLFFTATRRFGRTGTDELLSVLSLRRSECAGSEGVQEYSDNTYTGAFEILRDCGGTTTDYVVVAAAPNDGDDYLVGVTAQIVGDRDWAALDRAVQSFRVVGSIPR